MTPPVTAATAEPAGSPSGSAGSAQSTYGQILKSTALVGGSSTLNIGISMLRTKALAMLLGPSGFGLASLYLSVATLTQSVAGMGTNSSGVRQIAAAAGTNDARKIALTTAVLRRTSIAVGLLGALALILFAPQISQVTFNTSRHATAIRLLSAAVFFNLVSAGQGALIQGLRRISDFAKQTVIGSLLGTLATIPLVYFFREKGIVVALIATALFTLAASWTYSRRVKLQSCPLMVEGFKEETSALLKLGSAFMVSSLMTVGSAYVIRITLLHKLGLEATGLYQSAWTLGGMYVGMILQAMGADFYPRLAGSAEDNPQCNSLVNQQTRVSLLLAGPGVLATLTFAPLVVLLFYAAKFHGAIEVLRWICLGIALRVISWPMGFIIMAKGRQGLLIFCECAWTAVHLTLAAVFIQWFGLKGAGMAFFGSYVFHIFLIRTVVRRLSGFQWSDESRGTLLLYLPAMAVVFAAQYLVPSGWAIGIGAVTTLLSAGYSMKVLLGLVSHTRLPKILRPFAMGSAALFGRLLRPDASA